MSMTDPIADMLTRIRNANMRVYQTVSCQHSKLKENILSVMKEEGFISSFETSEENGKKNLLIRLRISNDRVPLIRGLKRISKPGLRVYQKVSKHKILMGGIGVTIVSTSQGVMTDKKAKQLNLGGEVLCQIW
ncbi:MAG: 30S ribosomal protein S8 [Nitrospirae bacterium]|nr:MAG: Ribosomal protein S8 [Leptospirillum sp. Group IV 'UBA BS']MCL4484809.1 30S ribosomal protein S8 [Nitrospirota bacterium]MCL5284437.1 30S ribosomal protein S8 [Nitrospirota bacterium]